MELLQHAQIIGTLPQWGMFVVLVLGAFKLIPILRQQTFDRKARLDSSWQAECQTLRTELRNQREECARENSGLKAQISGLQEQVFGMRKQHIAEQISLINVIMRSVDAPQLKGLLTMLERVHVQLTTRAGHDAAEEGARKDAEGT